jgi:hypothetical protein
LWKGVLAPAPLGHARRAGASKPRSDVEKYGYDPKGRCLRGHAKDPGRIRRLGSLTFLAVSVKLAHAGRHPGHTESRWEAVMRDETFTGDALEKALVNDELSQPELELMGMVKASDQKKHISFTTSGCDDWVDVPTSMIEKAERIGSSRCKDHSHPVFKLTLKQPETPEAHILSALLAQRASGQHAPPIPAGPMQDPWPAGYSEIGRPGSLGGLPGVRVPSPTNVAFWPVGDGRWACKWGPDCFRLASILRCHWECREGWATGDLLCFCTPY